MPHEDILYFGDTARVPYGPKSGPTVTSFVRQNVNYLRRYEPKHYVIACNTATALAMSAVKSSFPEISVSGVIELGARAAVVAAGNKQFPVIAVMATEATVRSRAYESAIARRRHHARLLFKPAPLLVPIIEEGRTAEDPLVVLAVEQYLRPLIQSGLDVLLLGCTHYPVLKGLIARTVGGQVPVIDSAEHCADDVHRRLLTGGLLRGDDRNARPGRLHCFVTDESPRFVPMAKRLLGTDVVVPPTWVSPEELYRRSEEELGLTWE
jgi:glutamate racemase